MPSKTEQVPNIMTFITLMTERALELPPDQRAAFIDGEILRLKDAFTAYERRKDKGDDSQIICGNGARNAEDDRSIQRRYGLGLIGQRRPAPLAPKGGALASWAVNV
jgi:hypothetical protein